MLTPIPIPDPALTMLYYFFPKLMEGNKAEVCIIEQRPMIAVPEEGWAGEVIDALRKAFDQPALKAWIALDLLEPTTTLAPGKYDLKVADRRSTSIQVRSLDTKQAVVSAEIPKNLLFEHWQPLASQTIPHHVPEWDAFLKFTTKHWYQWVGQFWEFEILRKDGAYYLTNTCAGHPWASYLFLSAYEKAIKNFNLEFVIRLDIIEGLEELEKWPEFVGFMIGTKTADGPQSFSHAALEMDAAIEKDEDAYLHIFSEDDAIPLKAKIRVAAKAEVWFMDLKEYE